MHSCSHFSVVFSSLQSDCNKSKRQAEPVAESATAKQRPVRNLSAYVKVEEDNKADDDASVEKQSPVNKAGVTAGDNRTRRQALL